MHRLIECHVLTNLRIHPAKIYRVTADVGYGNRVCPGLYGGTSGSDGEAGVHRGYADRAVTSPASLAVSKLSKPDIGLSINVS